MVKYNFFAMDELKKRDKRKNNFVIYLKFFCHLVKKRFFITIFCHGFPAKKVLPL